MQSLELASIVSSKDTHLLVNILIYNILQLYKKEQLESSVYVMHFYNLKVYNLNLFVLQIYPNHSKNARIVQSFKILMKEKRYFLQFISRNLI